MKAQVWADEIQFWSYLLAVRVCSLDRVGSIMMQIIEQTHDEKVAMYMKFKKVKLIEMLIQCNLILDSRPPHVGWDLNSDHSINYHRVPYGTRSVGDPILPERFY